MDVPKATYQSIFGGEMCGLYCFLIINNTLPRQCPYMEPSGALRGECGEGLNVFNAHDAYLGACSFG